MTRVHPADKEMPAASPDAHSDVLGEDAVSAASGPSDERKTRPGTDDLTDQAPRDQGVATDVRVVYLIGLPRSGTTLLAHLFAGLPDSLSLSEPYLARSIYGPWRLRRFMRRIGRETKLATVPPFEATTESAFQEYILRLAAANRLSNLLIKETFRSGQSWENVESLDRLASGTDPVITIIRHPYDVAVSSLRFARWWRGIVGRLLRLVAPALPLFRNDLALIEYCADNWNRFADWCAQNASHQIRYEDLARDPSGCLREACASVGLPFDPRMVDHTHPRGAFGGIGDPGVMNRPARPVGTGSVGRKHLLKPEFVEVIASQCADRCVRFGYEL